ncbi:hypothetical protein BGX23_012591 [Mortierella sp. AD031]|nr:hypothetical protein BGX23_012591 [Mortierella sp. AD031]KAG0204975.1 hypothetical protein BGX33_008173 [Mortierella sp. NVP41]
MVAEITSADQYTNLVNSGKKIIIHFYANWSGPCKAIMPFCDKLAADHHNVELYRLNVEDLSGLSANAGIRVMPTIQAYHSGSMVNELAPANPIGLQNLVFQLGS